MAHLDLQRGTYAAAETLLGSRESRRIGHNTRLERESADTIGVVYHATTIYTVTADGWAILNTGGWNTPTTWRRINALLPGPWAAYSNRGERWLYRSGQPVTPYADYLAVNVDAGTVGIVNGPGPVAELLSAADVDAIIQADKIARERRAVTRVARGARLLREHPAVGSPRTHTASAYERRVGDCARCTEERAEEYRQRRDALAAEHARGEHVKATTYPYGGCPWDCPERKGW